MKTPKRYQQMIADCSWLPLPKFKHMDINQRHIYLRGWFGCDDCPADDVCNLIGQILPPRRKSA